MENKEEVALKSLLLALIHSRQKSTRTFEIKNNSVKIQDRDLDFTFAIGDSLDIYISSYAPNALPKCIYENFLKADTKVLYWNKIAGRHVHTTFNNLCPSHICQIEICDDAFTFTLNYIDGYWWMKFKYQRDAFTFKLSQHEVDQLVTSGPNLHVSLRGSWNFPQQ